MNKKVIHAIILITTVVLSFGFAQTNLSMYDVQISAVLFIFLFIAKHFIIPKTQKSRLLESVILAFVVFSIVNSTGGIHSPYFFLTYFFLFSISLLLDPIISFTTTLVVIMLYLLSISTINNISELMPIFSFAFIAPFAMYLGEEYILLHKEEHKLTHSKKETFLFLSLIIKNHINTIIENVNDFVGDINLSEIKKHAMRVKRLIDKFEKTND